MKVVLLLANSISPILQKSKEAIVKVLEELEIQVDTISLENLPYSKEEVNQQARAIALKIQESSGVIAMTSVHIAGMHSAMQNFFEHMMYYEALIDAKPMFAITYSNCIGEKQAANKMIEAWGMIGGSDGGNMAFNHFIDFGSIQDILEKNIESFYRVMRQGRSVVMSSERKLYLMSREPYTAAVHDAYTKNEEATEGKTIKALVEVLNDEEHKEEQQTLHVDLSTKEQNIKELTQLLKSQMSQGNGDEFINVNQGTYSNPRLNKEHATGGKKLQNIPHYFVSQHDKALDITIQYLITDTEEKGIIFIKDGDCNYREGQIESPTVELATTSDMLTNILTKEITYQKAFMIGKLKVRGNFIVLSKLDQIFKAM